MNPTLARKGALSRFIRSTYRDMQGGPPTPLQRAALDMAHDAWWENQARCVHCRRRMVPPNSAATLRGKWICADCHKVLPDRQSALTWLGLR